MARRLIVVVAVLIATPAYANNPPAPPMFLGDVLVLPVMMLMTAFAGGYAIRRRLHEGSRGGRIWEIVAAVALILFAGMNEGYGFFILLIFAGIAAVRAIQLIVWAIQSRKADRPSHLEGASTARLAIAGALLLPISIAFAGLAPAFIQVWAPRNEGRVAALKKYVALQMAIASPRGGPLLAQQEKYERDLIDIMDSDNE